MASMQDGPAGTAADPIIRYERVNKWFGKLHRPRRTSTCTSRAGESARRLRPERLRQEHAHPLREPAGADPVQAG